MIDWNDNYYHRCEYCKYCGPTTTTYTGDGPIHKCWCKLDGIPGPLHDYYGKSCSRWEHTTVFDKEAKTLTLSLKKPWFDMIKSGEKKEEYREINRYWIARLVAAMVPFTGTVLSFMNFDTIVFTLGYPKADDTSRRLEFNNPKIRIGTGRHEWGAEPGKKYFVITWEEK